MQTAYKGERITTAKYVAFSKKADEEGGEDAVVDAGHRIAACAADGIHFVEEHHYRHVGVALALGARHAECLSVVCF